VLQAGTGIAELIALEISKQVSIYCLSGSTFLLSASICWPLWLIPCCFLQTNAPLEETRKKIWLVDSKVVRKCSKSSAAADISPWILFLVLTFGLAMLQGLIVSSRKGSLQHFKKPWAHDHEPIKGLLDAVKVLKL